MSVNQAKGAVEFAPEGIPPEVEGAEGSEPTLDRAIQSRIGDHLRAMYDDLMQQPVPDRFADLLGQLERRSEKESGR
jgi:hypothetical protein